MSSPERSEHFVTIFDSHYLPLGLCLHRSLEEQARPYHLWIVAVDDACADSLARMQPPNVTIVPLRDVETERLRAVKAGRTIGEYCWTLTPFLPSHVFTRAPRVERVTYVDSDLYFFEPPTSLIDELNPSGKHVLVTEHAFAPEYAANARYGRFCVQFMTFRNSEPARRVLAWWQERCLEWCFAYEEDGKFGDQKYLDDWPERFSAEVHVLQQTDRTVAPWNVAHLQRQAGAVRPVFYHFHGLRIVSPSKVLLYFMYRVGRSNRWIYQRYADGLRAIAAEMQRRGIPLLARPLPEGRFGALRYQWARLQGQAGWARL